MATVDLVIEMAVTATKGLVRSPLDSVDHATKCSWPTLAGWPFDSWPPYEHRHARHPHGRGQAVA